jgi:hypothetical protein
MDCPHCAKAFHDNWKQTFILKANEWGSSSEWLAKVTLCPACKNPTITLTQFSATDYIVMRDFRAYPANTLRKPTPVDVPTEIKKDYEEACGVLPISHKASAALSRRCLQAILQEQGYTQKNLAQQIDAMLNEPNTAKAIPTALRQTVDAIRNFGNFSAHPITDQTTLQVIEVDPDEAEWCLEILEEMFDHYYVKPTQAAARKVALDAKLAAAKKPLSK